MSDEKRTSTTRTEERTDSDGRETRETTRKEEVKTGNDTRKTSVSTDREEGDTEIRETTTVKTEREED